MRWHERLASRAGTTRELLGFFWQSRWWWLTPIILLLVLFTGLIVLAQASAIAPYIYTLF